MYTVYHIQGIKVGCTQNVQQRVINQQGYDSYEVLFETNCIEEASKMEIHFQNMLGYSTDETSYRNIKMIKSTKHTTTFKAEVAKLDLEFMLSIQSIRIGESEIVITQALAEWMMANLNKSQFNSEMFIYNQAFVKASIALAEEVATTKSDATIHELIRQWADAKGIYQHGDVKTQTLKLYEEAGELSKAILNSDLHEVIDAIGDCVVVLTSIAELANKKFELEGNAKITIESCTQVAYDVIKKRTGSMQSGTFVKDDK